MHRLTLVISASLILATGELVGWKPGRAIEGPSLCSTRGESHQLDYFLGDWVVESVDGSVKGHSTVTAILDGCALEENWHSDDGYAGRTVHAYFDEDGHWHEFYFDNVGKVHAFVGVVSDGVATYQGTSPGADGTTILHHVRIARRSAGGVDQLWEKSADGGRTWTEAFHAIYLMSSSKLKAP